MSDITAGGAPLAWRGRLGADAEAARGAPDARRLLQLALAAMWLLDGVLQYQGFMFTKGFSDMLAGAASGNPGVIARPVTWDATLVEHHLVLLNSIFATIQLLLGLGIAWRPTVRPALAASIVWSAAVWWLGEGLGLVLTGDINPVSGAPGAVILYALLAVLLWPADRSGLTPVHRRARRGRSRGPGPMGGAVAQPGLLRAAAGQPGAAGAARHDRGHGGRGAGLGRRP